MKLIFESSKLSEKCLLATDLNTAILNIAVVTKHGISDLQRLVAMVSLLRAGEAGKL